MMEIIYTGNKIGMNLVHLTMTDDCMAGVPQAPPVILGSQENP
jgi:hypothetical protein